MISHICSMGEKKTRKRTIFSDKQCSYLDYRSSHWFWGKEVGGEKKGGRLKWLQDRGLRMWFDAVTLDSLSINISTIIAMLPQIQFPKVERKKQELQAGLAWIPFLLHPFYSSLDKPLDLPFCELSRLSPEEKKTCHQPLTWLIIKTAESELPLTARCSKPPANFNK